MIPDRKYSLTAAAIALALASASAPAWAKGVMLMNRIGPSKMELYVANADGAGEHRLMPDSTALDYDASFSFDGKWIVFTSERDSQGQGQADIYRIHPDGTGLQRLTSDPAMEDAGVLSPDGTKLAYVSTNGGAKTTNIWVMDLKTHASKRLTGSSSAAPSPRMNSYFRPSWSPDGRWIAFSSDAGEKWAGAETGAGVGHSQPLSIYLIHPDGTGQRRLTTTTSGEATGSPRWSADGKTLLVYGMQTKDSMASRCCAPVGAPNGVTSQIYQVDVATGAKTQITNGPGLKTAAQYLPNGQIGYLLKGVPKDSSLKLGIVYSDGTAGPQGAVRSPSWSPDGSQVVYYKLSTTNRTQYTKLYSWNADYDYRYTDVFPTLCQKTKRLALTDLNFPFGNPDASVSVMNPDGANRQRIFHRTDGQALMPTWSPDCGRIAVGFGVFFGARDSHPGNILLIKADGSEVTSLTQGDVNIGFPAWAPDGQSIVYRVWGKERGLRSMNLADKSVKTLTTEWDNFPFYSPSGDRIVFTRQMPDHDFEVFTMKPNGTDQVRLTYTSGADAHATWTDDGKEIWFESARTGFKDEAPLYDVSPQPYAQIFLMNRDGSNVRQLTDSKWEDSMGTFLPAS